VLKEPEEKRAELRTKESENVFCRVLPENEIKGESMITEADAITLLPNAYVLLVPVVAERKCTVSALVNEGRRPTVQGRVRVHRRGAVGEGST
jgi:hypothetical protein